MDGEVAGPAEVGGLALEVLTGGAAAYGTVQLGGAVAGVDHDGLGEGLTQGLEDVEAERLQVGAGCAGRAGSKRLSMPRSRATAERVNSLRRKWGVNWRSFIFVDFWETLLTPMERPSRPPLKGGDLTEGETLTGVA